MLGTTIVMPTQVGIHDFPCCEQQSRGRVAFARHDEGRDQSVFPYAGWYYSGRNTTIAQLGAGTHTDELIRDFLKLPAGEIFGQVSRVATDPRNRVYIFQRKPPRVVVFDRAGNYLTAWGSGGVTHPHRLKIVDAVVTITDRSDSVAKPFTPDGKPRIAAWPPRRAFQHRLHRPPPAGSRCARRPAPQPRQPCSPFW